MNVVDIGILLLLLISGALGYRSGLIQSVFSLAGLLAGLVIASWNYKRFGDELYPLLHDKTISEAIWFCLLTLAVTIAVGIIGLVLKKLIHGVGLGWLDRIVGLFFGLVRGALLVTIVIVIMAAFFPDTRWMTDSRVARYFL